MWDPTRPGIPVVPDIGSRMLKKLSLCPPCRPAYPPRQNVSSCRKHHDCGTAATSQGSVAAAFLSVSVVKDTPYTEHVRRYMYAACLAQLCQDYQIESETTVRNISNGLPFHMQIRNYKGTSLLHLFR